MFWGVLGEEPIGSVFSKQDPQPALKQFYDLRVFLVGYPYAYRLECLVVHCDRLKKERLGNLFNFEHPDRSHSSFHHHTEPIFGREDCGQDSDHALAAFVQRRGFYWLYSFFIRMQ